jgi:hypothetical protein
MPDNDIPMKRRYLLRGVWVAAGILVCIAILFVVTTGFSYDGMCGGFFPGLSVRRPCSFVQYATGDMVAIAMVLFVSLWPLVLMLLVVPPFVGYLFDRRRSA